MIVNLDDLDEIIQREFSETDLLPISDELDIEATIDDTLTPKINIVSDIQVKPPDETQDTEMVPFLRCQ